MDLDEILIEEVRRRSILYDLGKADYKNLKKKENAWKEVAANVKLDGSFTTEECKKRWKGLRDSYKRCKKMRKVASGNSTETPKKKWKYFEALSFLENVTSSRRAVENIYKDEENLTEFIDINSADSYNMSPASPCSTSSREKKKKKNQDFLDLPASSISETCKAKQKEEQDSTALLFACLAKKLKDSNMPPYIINRIEAKVSALVFEEMEQYYSRPKTSPLNYL